MQASLSSLGFALLLAVFLVYVIMASTFESLFHPLVILCSLPLAAVGVVGLLYPLGVNLSVVALIGVIVLAGVVVGLSPVTAPPVTASDGASNAPTQEKQRLVGMMFFAIGLVAIGSQVLWARFLALLIPNTVHTYTITLAVVLIGIVVGSLLASRIFDGRLPRALSFGAFQILAGVSVFAVQLASEPLLKWFALERARPGQDPVFQF